MLKEGSVKSADPEGEGFLRALPWPVDTPGGRYFAEFDDEAPVTREGQLLFFAQFLHAGGRWERFVSKTPLPLCGQPRERGGGCPGHGNAVDLVRTLALCAYELGAGRSAQSAAVEHERHGQ